MGKTAKARIRPPASAENPPAPDQTLDPLASIRQWIAAGALYAVLTMAFLWPAITPWQIGERVQTLDSALNAAITNHTARSIVGLDSFWNFEAFYPRPDTLCLSEPMLTPAIIAGPLMALFGPAIGQNLYLYLCWWSAALGTWAFLRHRGLDQSSAFLGGIIASFSPDKYWHLAGHVQLLFQAGFPLLLLFLERTILTPASRKWTVFFVTALLLQVLAGFYMLAIFALWSLFLFPASAWWASRGEWKRIVSALRANGLILGAGVLLCLVILVPVAARYSQFGRQMPHNPLETVIAGSADLKGYLRPPVEPGRYVTAPGRFLLESGLRPPGKYGENSQYVGAVPLLLAGLGAFFGVWRIRRFREDRRRRADLVFGLGVASVALVAFILSLGPYWNGVSSGGVPQGPRLPFAWLYAWVEPIRFIRAPARFAFVVQWCLALAAAYGLWQLRRLVRHSASLALSSAAILLVMLEYFPLERLYQLPAKPTEMTGFLRSSSAPEPFVHVPAPDLGAMMIQTAWHSVPTVDGYSGYSPPYADAELAWFRREFPKPHSFVMLERWGINRISVPSANAEAAAHPDLRAIWSGDGRSLYEYKGTPPSLERFVSARRKAAGLSAGESVAPLEIISDFRARPGKWAVSGFSQLLPADAGTPHPRYRNVQSFAPFLILLGKNPLPPSVYTHMRIRVKIENWYDLREAASIYWKTRSNPDMGEARSVKFVIPADGKFHDLLVPLGEQIAWTADDPVTEIRLDLGRRAWNEVAVEELRFEQQAIQWILPRRFEPGLPR